MDMTSYTSDRHEFSRGHALPLETSHEMFAISTKISLLHHDDLGVLFKPSQTLEDSFRDVFCQGDSFLMVSSEMSHTKEIMFFFVQLLQLYWP